jgi:hypothetical protein
MAFDAMGAFVVTKPVGGNTGVTGVFDGLRVNGQQTCPFRLFLLSLGLVHVTLPRCAQAHHQPAIVCSAFVVPENSRVRGQVSGQITPIAAIFELIEDAVEDLPFAPLGRSRLLLLR